MTPPKLRIRFYRFKRIGNESMNSLPANIAPIPIGALCARDRWTRLPRLYESQPGRLSHSTMRKIAALIIVLLVAMVSARSVHAQAASQFIFHGQIADPPSDYGTYGGNIYYDIADKLFATDAVTGATIEVPLGNDGMLGNGLDLDADFQSFDGALVFHAKRRYRYNGRIRTGTFLHHIGRRGKKGKGSNRIGWVDIPEEPDTDEFGWVIDRGYADNTHEFTLFNGELYFYAKRAAVGHSYLTVTDNLYKIDRFDAEPVSLGWSPYPLIGQRLQNSTAGVIRADLHTGEPRYGIVSSINYTLINDTEQTLIVRANDIPASFSAFNDKLFFVGKNNQVGNPNPHLAGPYPDLGFNSGIAPVMFQEELARADLTGGERVYYDLHSMTYEQAEAAYEQTSDLAASSSYPDHLTMTNDSLFFTARPDGVSPVLYRLNDANELPTVVTFNGTQATDVTPLAVMNDVLWISADLGYGMDLFYLSQGNTIPHPLNVGDSVSRSASAFTSYNGDVFFTAKDHNNDWWTYVVRRPRVDKPKKLVTSRLTLNGRNYPNRPGLVRPAGLRLTVRCATRNRSTDPIDTLRIRIKIGSGDKRRVMNCRRAAVDVGEVVGCRTYARVASRPRMVRCDILNTDGKILDRRVAWTSPVAPKNPRRPIKTKR